MSTLNSFLKYDFGSNFPSFYHDESELCHRSGKKLLLDFETSIAITLIGMISTFFKQIRILSKSQ